MTAEEGYIKFHCHWQPGDLPAKLPVEELVTWRQKLYQHNLIGIDEQGIGFGNISYRLDKNKFLITGTSTGGIEKLTDRHLAIVTDYAIELNSLTCAGPVKASSESLSHAAIYAALPWTKAVVHVHHRDLWQKLLHIKPTTPADIAYGTPAMARAIQKIITLNTKQGENLVIMGGHRDGIITYGASLAAAGNTIIRLIAGL